MIKTIQWFAFLWLNLLMPRFKLMKLDKQNKISERDSLAHAIARKWAQTAIGYNGSEIRVRGIENVPASGGVLFIANHQSNFDIPILVGFVPRDKGFIAKKELLKIPFFSMWMRYIGCVFIDRKDTRQTLNRLNDAAEKLKTGHSLVIFPEGTRSNDGSVGHFKTGSLKIAFRANVPIVPVTIKGSMNIMPKGTSLIRSANVEVIISPPLFTEQLNEKDLNAITQNIRNIVVANLELNS
jgi:1-acyl-sn-glycerol-3-phosphate acyltransferase